MASPDKLRVFLCHSSADKPAVRELYKRLSAEKWIDPWLDSEKLLPGQDWKTEIEKALETAHVVIVTLSKGSVNKEGYLQREFKYALDIALEKPEGQIFIIPLKLEDIDKLELPRSLKALQYVDYFPKNKRVRAYEKMLESLRLRAAKFGITQDIESPTSPSRTKTGTKKESSNIDFSQPKIITSSAEFPILGIPFSQNRNFSGRKDTLNLIRSEFTKVNTSVSIYAITGLGGIGKTQIAVQYSYQYANEYDLVWWIRSETNASLSADYQALSNALLLPVKSKAEQIVFINLVKNFLENTERKWLLVFDNVESQDQIEKILPKKGNGHILITSQNPYWGEIANDFHLIPFTKIEGREFLNKRIKEKNDENADKLTNLFGGLPLAMEQACAYINKRGTSISAYRKLFEEQQQELWRREIPPRDYNATITTTWTMAFKAIREAQPIAEDLLNLFAFFAPDAIPLFIFTTYSKFFPRNMQKVVSNPMELEECLAALYSYSLIERDGDLISIHRLVQDVIRSNLPSEDLEKHLGLTLQIMEKAFPYDEYDISTWPICTQLLPHALAVTGYAEKHNVNLELTSNIYQKAGEYLRDKADYQRGAEAIKHALNIRQEMLEASHEKLAESLSYLGEIQHEKANFAEAYKLYDAALEIHRANPPTRYLARTLNNLGALFQDQGDFENARGYHEKALAILRTVLGDNHPQTATSLNNLGVLLSDQGDFETARKYHEEALAILRTVLGENDPTTATSLGNLGALFQEQGDFETARKYHEEVLAIERTVFGENHPSTATSLGNLGSLFQEQGDFETARKYHEEALAIRRTVLGENHPNTAISLNNFGGLLIRESKYVEARHYLEQALSIFEKAHGAKHHTLISILSNLATVMFRLKLYPQAREYASRAAKICKEAKVKYAECEKIKQLQISLPMEIGRRRH